jgi:phosphate transport system substrate-binding protein
MSSRDLKPEERAKYRDLVDVTIANDGIAIIVHPSNMVRSLPMAQLKEIYEGNTTNWKDGGGPDMTIVVVGRDSASGTREFFSESVMKKQDFTPTQLEKNSNGAVKQTIAQTPGAIGYVGLGYVTDSVKAIAVDGVMPDKNSVLRNKYAISRPLFMYTAGKPEGLVKKFLDYVKGPEGRRIVEEQGFVALKK